MEKVKTAVSESKTSTENLFRYQEIDLYTIFDIKLGENLRRKDRLSTGPHKTKAPSSITYSQVVFQDSVRICLMVATLKNLYLQSADIENYYLTAPCRQKIWTRAGTNFGQDKGKLFIIVKEQYGLNSSGASFRAFLSELLDNMGFKSSIEYPDVWIRPATKAQGEQYYKFILVYVDDLLAIIQYSVSVLKEVAEKFKLKNTR